VTAFRFTALAEADLAEILDYIARTGSEARAEGVLHDLLHAARLLAEQPRMGHLRGDLTPRAVLFWPVHSVLLVYRPDTRPLEIVRVISGWRDAPRLLEDED
jgi:plasmid stabilization system protein ParE